MLWAASMLACLLGRAPQAPLLLPCCSAARLAPPRIRKTLPRMQHRGLPGWHWQGSEMQLVPRLLAAPLHQQRWPHQQGLSSQWAGLLLPQLLLLPRQPAGMCQSPAYLLQQQRCWQQPGRRQQL
jgi:hypothetical protein